MKSLNKIEKLPNKVLKDLIKELNQIGKEEAPAKASLSLQLKELFDEESGSFMGRYTNVVNAAQLTIMKRIINDEF